MPKVEATPKTVLVVDDDVDIRLLIEALLAQEGYTALCAGNGIEALDLLKDHRADLILLDHDMPRMNGRQFTEAYRSSSYSRAPIVVMTASRNPSALADQIGVDGYLAKPFDLDQLIRVVDFHLRLGLDRAA